MLQSPILEIQNLSLSYDHTCIGNDISFALNTGEVLGIAGESGCGKSTLLKAIIDPAGYGVQISEGTIKYKGKEMADLSVKARCRMRGAEIGMVLQNPFAAFNPIRSYQKQFKETLKSHNQWRGKASVAEILELFKQLGLSGGKRILSSCPYEMSGGMNQRISIALSILLQPSLLLADEPTSALDATLQFQVVEQLRRLREISDISMILVSHNLFVIAEICDKTAIMHEGQIVEYGNTQEILLNPSHSYTRSLLKAVPKLHGTWLGCIHQEVAPKKE